MSRLVQWCLCLTSCEVFSLLVSMSSLPVVTLQFVSLMYVDIDGFPARSRTSTLHKISSLTSFDRITCVPMYMVDPFVVGDRLKE